MSKYTYKIGKRGICIEASEALDKAFDAVNGNALEWTIKSSSVEEFAKKAEKKLDGAKVAKARRVGSEVTVESSGPEGRGYKYSVIGTYFVLRRFTDGWRLVRISREQIPQGWAGAFTVSIPAVNAERLKQEAIGKAMHGFRVAA